MTHEEQTREHCAIPDGPQIPEDGYEVDAAGTYTGEQS
jgi:hypothetical protein